MSSIRRLAVIANVQVSGVRGGAETFHECLVSSLSKLVPQVDMIEIPCDESTFEGILSAYEHCYHLDLSAYDGVISSKAPTFAVSHPNHVCYLMHTVRVFYDMFDEKNRNPLSLAQRDLILRLDKELLAAPRTKKCFSIGQEVSARLEKYTGLASIPLHPGITSDGFYGGPYGDYIFMPGRLHPWKRVDLAIQAMRFVKSPVRLKIAGAGDIRGELEAMAGGDPNIEFLGYLDDASLREYYANALAVAFFPLREDYGYILHEAFKSEKPVVTCEDSGEPARFIENGENGFLCPAEPVRLAECFDKFYEDRERTVEMGERGRVSIESITWERVAETLLRALEE